MKKKSFRDTELSHARCVICNSVSHSEVATDLGDHSYNTFYEIPEYGESAIPAFVCYECEASHREVMTEFDMEDQSYDEDYEDE